MLLGERHADGVREALAERPRRRLDADLELALGVARDARAELAEILQLVELDVVTGQVGDRVQQHRAVAVRQHEPIAVVPMAVGRIESEVIVPEHLGDVGHAHRHAGVPRARGFDGIHRQHANRVREPAARRPSYGGRVVTAQCHRLVWI